MCIEVYTTSKIFFIFIRNIFVLFIIWYLYWIWIYYKTNRHYCRTLNISMSVYIVFFMSLWRNLAWGNQRQTIKHCLQEYIQWRDSRRKYRIQGYEVEKTMKIIREIVILKKHKRSLKSLKWLEQCLTIINVFYAR